MPRLPIPGQDAGVWGNILNEYLSQAHGATGAIRDGSVGAAAIADGVITSEKLHADVQASLVRADSALQAAPVTSVAGRTGAVSLSAADLSDVANLETKAHASVTYAKSLHRSTLPYTLANPLPTVMSSPPTIGVESTTTILASGAFIRPTQYGVFTYLGGSPSHSETFPYPFSVIAEYPGSSSVGPWAVEFDITMSGATFELYYIARGGRMRLLVNGQYASTLATYTDTHNNGSGYYVPITLAGGGTYRIRMELGGSFTFNGIRVGSVTDTVVATPRRGLRCMVLGDSFTEPTIVDTGGSCDWDGWVQQLSYVTGWDCWSVGSGSTGIVVPGIGGRKKFRDRVAQDILPYNPDIVIVAGGINDNGQTYAAVKDECDLLLQSLSSVPHRFVVSPFWPRDVRGANSGVLTVAEAIRASANAASVPYIDLLTYPDVQNLSSTVSRSMSVGSLRVYSVANVRDYDARVLVGDASLGQNVEVVYLTNGGDISGGDYNYYVPTPAGQPSYMHGIGQPIRAVTQCYMTGTGRQGATTGDGNSDVFTGNDGTHPTKAGHAYIARQVAARLARLLE